MRIEGAELKSVPTEIGYLTAMTALESESAGREDTEVKCKDERCEREQASNNADRDRAPHNADQDGAGRAHWRPHICFFLFMSRPRPLM